MALANFVPPPGEGKVTVLEENCQFLALPQDELEARYQVGAFYGTVLDPKLLDSSVVVICRYIVM